MEWLERLATCVLRELEHREGPLTLSINDLRVLAATESIPDACYWWSSLDCYLAFGMRGIDVEARLRGMTVASITFRLKRFEIAPVPSRSSTAIVPEKGSNRARRRLASDEA